MPKCGLQPDATSYSLIITAFAKGGQLRRALQMTQRMQTSGFEPPTSMLNDLIEACDDSNSVPIAQQLLIPLAPWEQLLADFTEALAAAGAPPSAQAGGAAGSKRQITRTCREKLCLYALTLGLMLGRGKLPAASLAPALGLTEQKTSFYLKQLGCKVDKVRALGDGASERTSVATLTLPIQFPKLNRGGAARR